MRIIQLVAALTIAGFIAGCNTNITELPVTQRDSQKYTDTLNQDTLKLVLVPQPANIIGTDKQTLKTLKSLTDTFGNGLSTVFADFDKYVIVPRTAIGEDKIDAILKKTTGKIDYKIKNADYMIIYSVSSFNFIPLKAKKKRGVPTFSACVEVKTTVLNLKKNTKEYTDNITGESNETASSKSVSLLDQAIENAIKNFSSRFVVNCGLPAVVLQTRGSGQAACINIGENYGLAKGIKMEFFTRKERNGEIFNIPFANGKIIETGKKTAWIEVDNYEQANVMENNLVRIGNDQSKSFFEKINPSRFWNKKKK